MDRDVMVSLLAAAITAAMEIDALDETPVVVPDSIEHKLRRGAVAEAVLRRVLRAAPPDRRRRLGAMIREERVRHLHVFLSDDVDLGTYPVLPEVARAVGDALEDARRRRLSDRDLDAMLFEAERLAGVA